MSKTTAWVVKDKHSGYLAYRTFGYSDTTGKLKEAIIFPTKKKALGQCSKDNEVIKITIEEK